LVMLSAVLTPTTLSTCLMGFTVGDQPATAARSIKLASPAVSGTSVQVGAGATYLVSGLAPGPAVFTAKYKAFGECWFSDRNIVVVTVA
jgi:hypothetical protein